MEEKRPEFREAIHKTLVEIWRPRCAGREAPTIAPALCVVSVVCAQCPLWVMYGSSDFGFACIPQHQVWQVRAAADGVESATKEAREMVLALAKLLPYKERVAYKSWGKVVVK